MLSLKQTTDLLVEYGFEKSDNLSSPIALVYFKGEANVVFFIEEPSKPKMYLGNRILMADEGIVAECRFPTNVHEFLMYLKGLEYIGSYDFYRDFYQVKYGKPRTKVYRTVIPTAYIQANPE